MFQDDLPRPRRDEIVPGGDLSAFSIEDLEERLEILDAEIARTKAMIDKKKTSLAVADSIFKTGQS